MSYSGFEGTILTLVEVARSILFGRRLSWLRVGQFPHGDTELWAIGVCRDFAVTQELTDCCYVRQRNNEMRILYLCWFNDAFEIVWNRTGE
jgi:hypothetical protein